jgi:hypothetical protein
MKNITLSADERLIESARQRARRHNTTLNNEFRRWLSDYVKGEDRAREFDDILERLSYVEVTRKFSRDEMNER